MRSNRIRSLVGSSLFALGIALLTGGSSAPTPLSTTLIVSVADAKTGAPLEGAQVRLPEVGRTARANWIGEARFVNLSEGKYQVQVRHLGYAGSEITIALRGDSAGAIFMLEQLATVVDTVKVEARPKLPSFFAGTRREEFEARRAMGIGHFLTDSILGVEGSHEIAHVLATRLPALRVELESKSNPNSWTVVGIGTTGVLPKKNQPDSFATGLCPVDIYVDGFYVSPTEGSSTLQGLVPRELAGIELYNKNEAPAAYRRQGLSCKVLLIWRRYG